MSGLVLGGLDPRVLVAAGRWVGSAVARGSDTMLDGVCLDGRGPVWTLAATDRRRVHVHELGCAGVPDGETYVFDAAGLRSALARVRVGGGPVALSCDEWGGWALSQPGAGVGAALTGGAGLFPRLGELWPDPDGAAWLRSTVGGLRAAVAAAVGDERGLLVDCRRALDDLSRAAPVVVMLGHGTGATAGVWARSSAHGAGSVLVGEWPATVSAGWEGRVGLNAAVLVDVLAGMVDEAPVVLRRGGTSGAVGVGWPRVAGRSGLVLPVRL